MDEVVEAVVSDLHSRSEKGLSKYGVTLERTDLSLRDWCQHAYEECLDQANYLKRIIMELEKHSPLDYRNSKNTPWNVNTERDVAWVDEHIDTPPDKDTEEASS